VACQKAPVRLKQHLIVINQAQSFRNVELCMALWLENSTTFWVTLKVLLNLTASDQHYQDPIKVLWGWYRSIVLVGRKVYSQWCLLYYWLNSQTVCMCVLVREPMHLQPDINCYGIYVSISSCFVSLSVCVINPKCRSCRYSYLLLPTNHYYIITTNNKIDTLLIAICS